MTFLNVTVPKGDGFPWVLKIQHLAWIKERRFMRREEAIAAVPGVMREFPHGLIKISLYVDAGVLWETNSSK
jgi:hypothetical protein